MKTTVIIPALDEQDAIGNVIGDIPRDRVSEIIVVDNGSRDRTADVARAAGARVLHEPERGYGAACLRGIAAARNPDVFVFLDGDYSDYPEELGKVLDPVASGEADLVLGSRIAGPDGRAVLPLHAYFGNHLITWCIRALFGHRYTDLGPLRAIRAAALQQLNMADRNFGWTVEMQVKALQQGLRVREVPVRYRARIGTSKVSGTVWGSVRAAVKILYSIARLRLSGPAGSA